MIKRDFYLIKTKKNINVTNIFNKRQFNTVYRELYENQDKLIFLLKDNQQLIDRYLFKIGVKIFLSKKIFGMNYIFR